MELIINDKPLAPYEQGRLRELEEIIRDNFLAYVAVGEALLEIRESRLYRTEDGRTWEGYCRELWDMSHQRADQLIAAKAVVENLTTIVVKGDGTPDWELLPANESQARELARLEPEEQVRVWRDLIDFKQSTADAAQPFRLTAKTVKAAVRELKGESITKSTRAAKDHIRKQSKSEDRKSERFVVAIGVLMTQIELEKDANWRHTSREAVFNSLCAVAQAVGECGEETIKAKRVLWRGNNTDKLLAAGIKIFRLSASQKSIEQLESADEWLVYGEYETTEQGLAAFDDLMLDPLNIQA
ncbi:MAG: hypothetical protein LBD10_14550 [Desulfobulbus sp.]|jgi:hypothetical protein|uniref:hypothetical protein n=1 Tax=Desulfobulbus sp. TaxID=895 RepID=UPI0028489C56|nr:hypothetical protein [Desulfobulbus sp.]MDR2551409.1 hypothetical protein [Desulfobulbus sp.]